MKEKLKVYAVAIVLAALGIGLTLYKHFALGFPLLSDQKTAVSTLEAKIEFEAHDKPVLVSLALPDAQQGIAIVNENYTTSGYGFAELEQHDGTRRAQWTRRSATGKQMLYYRVQVLPSALEQTAGS